MAIAKYIGIILILWIPILVTTMVTSSITDINAQAKILSAWSISTLFGLLLLLLNKDRKKVETPHLLPIPIRRKVWKKHPCPVCGKIFTTEQAMGRHTNTHNKKK